MKLVAASDVSTNASAIARSSGPRSSANRSACSGRKSITIAVRASATKIDNVDPITIPMSMASGRMISSRVSGVTGLPPAALRSSLDCPL